MKSNFNPVKASGGLKKALIIIAFLIAAAAVLVVSAFIMVPLEAVHGVIERNLGEKAGLTLTQGEFQKVFPLGMDARNVEISEASGKDPVIYIDTLRARLSPIGIFSGGIKVLLSGEMGGGAFDGSVLARPGSMHLEMRGKGIRLSSVPQMRRMGIDVDGRFRGAASIRLPSEGCPEGVLDIDDDELGEGNLKFLGMPMPFGVLKDAGLSAGISGCNAKIEKAWVEGSELSAFVSGSVKLARPVSASALDLTLELTPKGSLADNEMLLSFISQFKRSSNFYSVRVRGTIGDPAAAP